MYKFTETKIEGLKVIDPLYFEDERGILKKTFEKNIFIKNGIDLEAMEEIETTSHLGVLRGLHFQTEHSQGKLIRVVRGEIFDVAVDLRKESETFGEVFTIKLSEQNKKMLYIPPHFAHGCLIMQENTTFYYLCSETYYSGYDSGILWNDPDLNINWPIKEIDKVFLSEKDKKLQSFEKYCKMI